MRKTIWVILIGVVVSAMIAFTTTSCNKNEFNKELADSMKKLTFNIDDVDPTHDWSMLNEYSVSVLPNVKDVKRVEILSQNPYTSLYAEKMAVHDAVENEKITINYSVPTMADSIYIAAVDADEKYTIVAAPYMTTKTIDFSHPNTTNKGTFNKLQPQTVYYCYDISYPEASSSWSYNDVVMSLSKEQVNDYVMRFTVTLVALGTTKQVAAGLRINGIKANKIAQVYTDDGKSFVKDSSARRTIIQNDDIVLTAKDGSPVINLYDDAHAAFFIQNNDNGTITRYQFNVSHEPGPNYMGYPAVTVTYNVVFNDGNIIPRLGFADLDLFISYYYITAPWEIHKYRYKFQESLNEFYEGHQYAYADNFAWALEVPYGQFRYPCIGYEMGGYKNGVAYGTYNKLNHAFGEWVNNKKKANDWCLYPNASMVY